VKSTHVGITCLLLALASPAVAQETLPGESSSADLFARDSYRIDTVVCPFKGEIDYEPGDIECGLLEVPENREDPDSRFIELHFVKLNSRWGKEDYDDEDEDSGLPPGKRDDPVIYLTGGPGAKVNYYVGRLKDHTLLDHRDLYILEQRGIGFSGDFCPLYGGRKPETDDVATFAESLAAAHTRKADCANKARAAGVDLTGYNTIENARDVKVLRRALGFEQWNVWGISYGSILGQAYVKEDPDGILAVAIDAIMPLEIRDSELYWRIAHWYIRDLQKLQEICQNQPDCARRYPDIVGRLREAVKTVVDSPIEVEVGDVEIFPSGKARFFQDIIALLPFVFFYEQDNYPGLPGVIHAWADAVEKRDETLFKAIAAAASSGGFGDISQGMYNAIFCMDGDSEAQARAGKKDIIEYPVLGAAIGSAESYDRDAALCRELGMLQRPAEEFEAVQTRLPALIIEGDMDPITPPPNARAILPGFENGTYVEFPYAGHGPSRSVECAGDLLNKFYDNPGAEPDLSCVDEMEEPKIWAPMFTTNIAPRLMVMLTEDKKALAIPGIWAGASILISLIAFLQLTFLPLGRKIDGVMAADTAGARAFAWLAALLSVAAISILGAAVAVTADASELMLIFGLVPWAKFGAWSGVLAGVVGLVTIGMTIRAQLKIGLPIGTLLGFLLTGGAAVGLGSFLIVWGLGPF
jgi:pimeloyl-ACP methyl ester carboxylesterase